MTMGARTRTVRWEDPRRAASAAVDLDGLDLLRAVRAGDLPTPPVAATLGFAGFDVDAGWASFRLVPGEYHYNPSGVVHGGILASLADTAMGCAVQTTLPAGEGFVTLELKTNFVRAVTVETGEITAIGEVLHRGRRVATAEARVIDGAGRLLAHASTTCLLLEGEGS